MAWATDPGHTKNNIDQYLIFRWRTGEEEEEINKSFDISFQKTEEINVRSCEHG